MDPDKQLIRTQDGDTINLAIGEPIFLQNRLSFPYAGKEYQPEHYPPHQGQPELLTALRARHPGMHVVVANGAKQALLAAMYATREHLDLAGVVHRAPHWPSYPTLSRLSGIDFFETAPKTWNHMTHFVSSPNNPDGREWQGEKCDVWDAAYAHSVYGWSGVRPDHKISVWSAAKLFGLTGERIGWAATDDEELAEKMADYIEKTTSGVNIHAQNRLTGILRMADWCNERNYEDAREDLRVNGQLFRDHLMKHTGFCRGTPMGDPGMFAWFYACQPEKFKAALVRAKVALVDGRACGMKDEGWYRMSMGQTVQVTEKALSRLALELNDG